MSDPIKTARELSHRLAVHDSDVMRKALTEIHAMVGRDGSHEGDQEALVACTISGVSTLVVDHATAEAELAKAREEIERIKSEWAIISRACGNWPTAARALLENEQRKAQVRRLREALEAAMEAQVECYCGDNCDRCGYCICKSALAETKEPV